MEKAYFHNFTTFFPLAMVIWQTHLQKIVATIVATKFA
jgi:hypothetical protein